MNLNTILIPDNIQLVNNRRDGMIQMMTGDCDAIYYTSSYKCNSNKKAEFSCSYRQNLNTNGKPTSMREADSISNIKVSGKNINSIELILKKDDFILGLLPFTKISDAEWKLENFTTKNQLLTISLPWVLDCICINYDNDELNESIITWDSYMYNSEFRRKLARSNFYTDNGDYKLIYTNGFVKVLEKK